MNNIYIFSKKDDAPHFQKAREGRYAQFHIE